MADIDAELERRRGYQHLELAFAQTVFGVRRTSCAAVVGSDAIIAKALGQLMRHPLGKAPGVHRDQRRAMRLDQMHEAIVDFFPDLMRHHGFERRTRNFDREVHRALVALVDDDAGTIGQKPRDLLDRLLRRRKSDALQLAPAHMIEAFERQRQVRTTARLQHGVDLVDDDDASSLQH